MHELEQSPFTTRGFIGACAFLAVVIALAFVVVASNAFRSTTHKPPAAHTIKAGRPSTTVVASDPKRCSLPAGSQTVPQTTPIVASWVTVGQMQEPQGSGIGPQRRVAGVGVCFAHSPLGALYAAVNFFAEGTTVQQAQLLTDLAAPSHARTVLIAQSQGADALIQDDDGNPGAISLAGFRVTDYTPAAEDLTVVLNGPGDSLAAVQMTELWADDDWKLEIPSSGQLTATAADTLAGFIPWEAQ